VWARRRVQTSGKAFRRGAPAGSYAVQVAIEQEPGFRPLLTVTQLSQALGLSRSWIYRRTGPKAVDPIPVVRFGKRGIRFNPDHILLYIRSRERHPISDKMEPTAASSTRRSITAPIAPFG
jgi:predicted DNA-binding transcriptional regulator AlpA